MNPEKIFFSYSRSDSEFALKLGKDLRDKGANIWLDQLDISPGSTWDVEVENALNSSAFMLALLSPDSMASKNVMDEVSYGIEEKKKVIPVLIRNCKIPFRLRRLQFVDFSKNYDQALARLLNTLSPESGKTESTGTGKTEGAEKTKNFFARNKYAVIAASVLVIAFIAWIIIRPGNNTIVEVNPDTTDEYSQLRDQQISDSLSKDQELKDSIMRETEAWDIAVKQNTIEAYKDYQKNFSQGVHYEDAQREIIKLTARIETQKDEKDWSKAIDKNTIAGFELYKSQHPAGVHFADAGARISGLRNKEADEKAWTVALNQGSIQSFRQYLSVYPDGVHRREATNKILELSSTEFAIGKNYQGGIIFIIDASGKHGLIGAKDDLSDAANMHTIEKSIDSYRPDGFRDWRLPTKDELNTLFNKKQLFTGFKKKYYWSSTKKGEGDIYWVQHLGDGKVNSFNLKDFEYAVRLVRKF